jgi:hypothetical protein
MLSRHLITYSVSFARIVLCTIMVITISSSLMAQVKTAKELKQQLGKATKDVDRLKLLSQLNVLYTQKGQNDSVGKLTKEMLLIAQRSKNDTLLVHSYMNIGTYLVSKADFEASLEFYFKALHLAEELKLTNMMILLNNNIGGEYEDLENFNEAIKYTRKVKTLIAQEMVRLDAALKEEPQNKELLSSLKSNYVLEVFNNWHMAYDYLNTNEPRLALGYVDKANQLIKSRRLSGGQIDFIQAHIYWTYGQISEQLKNLPAAGRQYQYAARYSDSLKLKTPLVLTLNSYSHFLYNQGQYTPAKNNAIAALQEAKRIDFVLEIINSAAVLSKIYTKLNMPDSANYYYQLKDTYQDRAFNQQRISRLQDITFTEQIHQAEEQAKQAELEEQRKHNIQYAGIAIAIISFMVMFLLLSRSTMASPRLIEFLGVVGLLILFEFINLILHPFIGKYTHHSPLLMLGIMVAIAALLVPMHHKLEGWMKRKFLGVTSHH